MSDDIEIPIPEPEEPSASELTAFILPSIKKMIPIPLEDKSFDLDIIININSALARIHQLGAISRAYTVTSEDDTYDEAFSGSGENVINLGKMLIYLKVKYGFDTQTMTASNLSALENKIKDIEWQISTAKLIEE